MESVSPIQEPNLTDTPDILELKVQHAHYVRRVEQILITLRAFIYDKVSYLLAESSKELERVNMFGAEYRVIIDRLNCLETAVGDELLAATDDLNSTNPAKWNSCALICRNVILKLARLIWIGNEKTYVTQQRNVLDITPNKEKNILFAYIDFQSKTASSDKKTALVEASDLVRKIYDKGSKGKQQVSRQEARDLLVDTFKLVDLLNQSTGLQTITSFV